MKRCLTLIVAGILVVACGSAFAIDDNWGVMGSSAVSQPGATTADDCQRLTQDIDATFQQAVQARVPKQDPSTYVQNGYDVKSLLAKDTSAGLGKLTQLLGGNFSGMLQDMVNGTLQQVVQKGQQNFSSQMNSVLGEFRVPGVQFQQALTSATSNVTSGLSSAFSPLTSKVSSAVQSLTTQPAVPTPTPAPASTVYSPYGAMPAPAR